MALLQLSLDTYDENKLMIDRFKDSKGDYHYNDKTNLIGFEAANEAYKLSILNRNDYATKFDAAVIEVPEKLSALQQYAASFKTQTAETFTKESDEYVRAGGIRPSETAAKIEATRAENKLAREAVTAVRKAEAAREKAEAAILKMEEAKQKNEKNKAKP